MHVSGLQVAVIVGLEGDPLGRKGLGLPIPAPAEVVGTVEVIVSIVVSTVVPPVVVIGTSSEGPIDITQSCPFPGAKKCLADARASSWLASLIHWTLLGISVCLAICPSGVLSDITFHRGIWSSFSSVWQGLLEVDYLISLIQGLQAFAGLLSGPHSLWLQLVYCLEIPLGSHSKWSPSSYLHT